MKRFLQSTFLAASLAASWWPAAAQVRRPYVAIKVDVPFKFKVGNRSFRPGSYEFLSVGTNLMALRDARARIVASLVTRSVETGVIAPSTRLVFHPEKKQLYLAQIKIQDLSQVLEIRGEELAIPPSPPPVLAPAEVLLFNTRQSGVGGKQ
ncbi:MAG TPA: hypothetical protein VNX88_07720 [Terriglobales bacterium]|jgi:hypothetical protein|nr:hypothetical protein [Terriglobales bacterium]